MATISDGRVAVIGDSSTEIAIGTLDIAPQQADWIQVDVAAFDGWPGAAKKGAPSQFEAIAVDGTGLAVIVREDPAEALVVDLDGQRVVSVITLDGSAVLGSDWDDPASRGEGVVLLAGGRLLIAKEKDPAALIEFALTGNRPAGIARTDLLSRTDAWQAPNGNVTFTAVARWNLRGKAAKELADVSAITVGPDGALWLLSDQSQTLGRLSLDEPLDPSVDRIKSIDRMWRLPGKAEKPEGLTFVGDDEILIVLDTKKRSGNGLVVRTPLG